MAITINTGFNVTTGSPLDGRTQVANQSARLDLPSGVLYPGLVVYEIDTQKNYQYIGGNNTEEENWKEISFERLDTIENTLENGSVNAADKLTTPRTITLSGDISGSVTFDGSENVSIDTSINNNKVALEDLSTEVQSLLASAFDFKGGLSLNSSILGNRPTNWSSNMEMTLGDVYKVANDGWFYNTYCTTGDTVIYTSTSGKKASDITSDNYMSNFLILETNIDIASSWPSDDSLNSKVATIGAIKEGIDRTLNARYIWYADLDYVVSLDNMYKNLGGIEEYSQYGNGFVVMDGIIPTDSEYDAVLSAMAKGNSIVKGLLKIYLNGVGAEVIPDVRKTTVSPNSTNQSKVGYKIFNCGDMLVYGQEGISLEGYTLVGETWKRIAIHEAKENVDGLMSAGDKVNLTNLLPLKDMFLDKGLKNAGQVTNTGLYLFNNGRPATTWSQGDNVHYGLLNIQGDNNHGTLQIGASYSHYNPITTTPTLWIRNINSGLANSEHATSAATWNPILNVMDLTPQSGVQINDIPDGFYRITLDGANYNGAHGTTGAPSQMHSGLQGKYAGGTTIANFTTYTTDSETRKFQMSMDPFGELYIRGSRRTVDNVGSWSGWKRLVGMPADGNAVGSYSKPVYVNANGVITACSVNSGSEIKHMYVVGGAFATSSKTVGGSTSPIYMNAGTFTQCTGSTVNFQSITERGNTDPGSKIYLAGMYLTDDNAQSGVLNNHLDIAVPYSGSSENTGGVYISTNGHVLFGAAWNDYAEYRACPEGAEPGRVVCENGDDTVSISTERLQPGALIVSDTFGFAIGQTDISNTPIAVAGRVLAYPCEDRDSYKPGDAVCAGPNGTVSKMTREEIKEYPERIIGTVSAIPQYETWGTGNVPVNGRIWIKI